MEELFYYFAGATGLVGAIMTAIKQLPFVKKNWYTGIAIGLTVVTVGVMTSLVGWNFGVFFGGLLAVFVSEYGLDKKIFTPILEKLLKG